MIWTQSLGGGGGGPAGGLGGGGIQRKGRGQGGECWELEEDGDWCLGTRAMWVSTLSMGLVGDHLHIITAVSLQV